MPTCSAESRPDDGPAYAAAMSSHGVAAGTTRATWVRLGVAVLIGVSALLVPVVEPHVGHTGAVYTDHEQVSVDVPIEPTETATATPTDTPSETAPDAADAAAAGAAASGTGAAAASTRTAPGKGAVASRHASGRSPGAASAAHAASHQ